MRRVGPVVVSSLAGGTGWSDDGPIAPVVVLVTCCSGMDGTGGCEVVCME